MSETNVVHQRSLNDLLLRAHKELDAAANAIQKSWATRVKAGMTLLEMWQRVEAGEAGDIEWWDYYGKHFAHSRRDAEKVMEFARSENPQAAYEAAKEKNRQEAQKSRQRRNTAADVSRKNSLAKTMTSKNGPPKHELVQTEDREPEPEPVIQHDLVDQAIFIIRQMSIQNSIKILGQAPAGLSGFLIMLRDERALRFLNKSDQRDAVRQRLLLAGTQKVYAGLRAYAINKNYKLGWAAHAFKEIFGAWPHGHDRVQAAILPGFLIEEWIAYRKKPQRKREPNSIGSQTGTLL